MNDALQQKLHRLRRDVLGAVKHAFVGKDDVIDLLGLCLIGGENLFLLGPPGTAKTALVHELGRLLDGHTFDYLLTRFTEPNELFGPFDIRRLREGDLITNTEGMLPEASLVFLDELLNANSAILNSLLMVLNERVFRRGRETRKLPTLMVVGASNRLPEDEALRALFDRFLLRVRCENVPPDRLQDVLDAGWALEQRPPAVAAPVSAEDIRELQQLLPTVDMRPAREAYLDLVHRLRNAGIPISDRRAVKLQRLLAASALLSGREAVKPSDLWVLRHIWDTLEQQEILAAIVNEAIDKDPPAATDHPRSREDRTPNAEELAADLDTVEAGLKNSRSSAAERAVLKDRLRHLAGRCEWLPQSPQRTFLQQRINTIWDTTSNPT